MDVVDITSSDDSSVSTVVDDGFHVGPTVQWTPENMTRRSPRDQSFAIRSQHFDVPEPGDVAFTDATQLPAPRPIATLTRAPATEPEQVHTVIDRGNACKNWCFTLNNFVPQDWSNLVEFIQA